VGVDPDTHSPVLLLVDEKTGRGIPLWIGPNEARAISMELEHITSPRPMTHELMKNVMEQLNARVERVIIEDMRDNTYFASLVIKVGNRRLTIDSRPSDAVALALKFQAPLFLSDAIMKKDLLIDLETRKTGGEIGRIYGLSFQDLSPPVARYFGLSDNKGVVVTGLDSGGAAEEAGIKKGDVLLGVDGKKVKDSGEFKKNMLRHEASEVIRVEVFREGETVTCTLSVKK
jgi:bifunctional DNase/RNase